MALQYVTALQNARLDEITAAIDADVGAGTLRIFAGTQPATGGAETTVLATLTLTDPAAPAAAAGVLTLSTIADDTSADATGTATWFRIKDNSGDPVLDGPIADLNLNTNEFVIGVNVAVSSFVITEGNP